MPQPKSGRITRSPLEVPRMIQMDWRTLCSYSEIRIPPVSSSATPLAPFGSVGSTSNPQPAPRYVLDIKYPFCEIVASTDENRAGGDDLAGRQILRIVAGHRGVAASRRLLAVDNNRRTAHFDRGLIAGRFLKRCSWWRLDVSRRIRSRAVHSRRRLAHNVDVAAEPAIELSGEGMRQGRGNRSSRRRNHDDVRIDRRDLIILFGSRLSHPSFLN